MYASRTRNAFRRRSQPPESLPWRSRWGILAVVASALLAVGFAHAQEGSASATASAPAYGVVSVRPGETLWGIASERYPDADPRLKVAQIEELNGLRGPTIEAGQRLKVPLR